MLKMVVQPACVRRRTSLYRLVSIATHSKEATPNLGGLAWLSFFIALIASFGIPSGADHGRIAARSGNQSFVARTCSGCRTDTGPFAGNRKSHSCGGWGFHSDRCCIYRSNLESGIRSSCDSSDLEHGCNTTDKVGRSEYSGLAIQKKMFVLPPGERL